MTASVLKTIDPLVESFLNEKPSGGTTSIYGFEFADPNHRDDAFESFKRDFEDDANRLRADLTKAGISPIAVLPEKFWMRIVKAHGLWNLVPNVSGQVGLEIEDESKAAKKAFDALTGWWTFAAVFAAVSCSATYQAINGPITPSLLGLVAPVWVAHGINLIAMYALAHLACIVATAAYAQIHYQTYDEMVATLAAKRHIAGRGGEKAFIGRILAPTPWKTHMIGITLPEPPEEVAHIINRVYRAVDLQNTVKLHVVAEPAAVGFTETPTLVLAKAIHGRITAERLERERAAADPIICACRGRAIAIIAQFGDCPIEAEAVRKAISMDAFHDRD